ncbi:AI-2E family transporter [Agromyces luteolus]|uniref:AI-2E family transporter n=1 Tax=Agromyces luteolus TaxID=88373 RepID=A0A7C9LSD2_9MICO|nr:AI-2E family transporter [Agromyces luteolus]MUN06676.1 AI-2E family transporter [Agromyces luteolus]GLK27810.1 AI-2E family transporter [Agromyces luteolus]
MALGWWRRERASASEAEPHPDDAASTARTSVALPRAAVILLGFAGVVVVMFGLAAARSVVAPAFLALVLTICVHPVRIGLVRRGVPVGLATGAAIVAVFALLAGFVATLVFALAQFTTLLPEYAPQIQAAGANLSDALEGLGIGAQQAQTIVDGLEPSRIIDVVGAVLGGVAGITFSLVVILTLLILMAMDGTYAPAILAQLRPRRAALVDALVLYTRNVRRYMVVTTGLGVAQGVLNWIALLILQVPGALLWGVLSFICSFIPNIGYFIAIVPPLVFGFLSGGWPVFIAVLLVYGVVNAVVQSIVQPKVVGGAVRLSETITFVSVLFWALVIGPVGAVLAVPLTLLVRSILLDADPTLAWWRPATGDVEETKGIAAELSAKARAQAKADRAARPPRGRAARASRP